MVLGGGSVLWSGVGLSYWGLKPVMRCIPGFVGSGRYTIEDHNGNKYIII